MNELNQWFTDNEAAMLETADYIFRHPETAFQEKQSSRCLAAFLERQGFTITWNTAGLDTAFTAVWGSGKPVIGFLAEYDALPGLGQEISFTRSPLGTVGHGCGHNLLGTAAAAAACALKADMEQSGINGTLYVYGCPAEEILAGKTIMNKQGVFSGLDAAVTWHPFDKNRISNDIWLAQDVRNYTFYGVSSHAARSPELGRSALDACELMNVGVNYLREHVSDDVRIHYSYTSPPQPTNVVPDFARLNYFIRSAKRGRTDDVVARVDDCARGAALMTGTKLEIDLEATCKEMKVNRPLAELYYEAMKQIPTPEYTAEELQFAEMISKEAGLQNNGVYFAGLQELEPEAQILPVGTDVSDVSHTVPTITISAAAMCKGTPLHHWSTTAQAGMSIGQKGMLYAARCMALGTKMLITSPGALKKAWEAHQKED